MTGVSAGPTIRRIDDPDEEGPDVRPAEQRDVPRIAATLTVALADSRWTRWALPDDGRMQRLTRLHELDAGHRGVGHPVRLGHRRRHGGRRLGAAGRRRRHRSPAGRRRRRAGPRAAVPAGRPRVDRRRDRRDDRDRPPDGRRTGGWRTSASARPRAGRGSRPPSSRRSWCAATPRARSPRPRSTRWANARFLRGFGFEVTLVHADGGRRAAALGRGAAAAAPLVG